ncbi:3077_t:CDS:2 [Ambispora leptoticha]|uniref:3077_t:CDS:1 n=1 Tax=Ambispora leptoticha TaxID=144679 RepID=A0A9N8Z517_9GLOM|nr:3077_t:CDS:2 [Ambispora leptoticha]
MIDDEEMRELYPQQWQLPPSESVNQVLVQQGLKHRDALNLARNGDSAIKKKLDDWSTIIELLGASQQELVRAVPSSQGQAEDPSATELRSLYNEVQRMMSNRKERIQEAQKFGHSDDIGPDLRKEAAKITSKGIGVKIESAHFEDFFAQRLARYEPFLQMVKQETENQENLINSIIELNHLLRESRQHSDANSARVKALQNLEAGYDKFKEILKNIREGEQFYRTFEIPLTEWKNACQKFVESRKHYAENHLDQLVKSLSSMSISNQQQPQPSAPPASEMHTPSKPVTARGVWTSGSPVKFMSSSQVNQRPPSQPSSPSSPWTRGMPVSFTSSPSTDQRQPNNPTPAKGWHKGQGIQFSERGS